MGNTLYTIFLLGLPLLVCIILWHTVKRLIARYRTSDDESAGAGCLNLVIFMCLALVFIGVLVAINNHFVTTITVDRNEKGEITYRSSHRFSVHKGEDADNPTGNRLVNRSDIPVYLYSETYSIMAPLAVTAPPTYTIMCAPGQTIPLNVGIDYFFEPAPEHVQVKSDTDKKVKWVLDSVVPYDYVLPVAPNAPVILNKKEK